MSLLEEAGCVLEARGRFFVYKLGLTFVYFRVGYVSPP